MIIWWKHQVGWLNLRTWIVSHPWKEKRNVENHLKYQKICNTNTIDNNDKNALATHMTDFNQEFDFSCVAINQKYAQLIQQESHWNSYYH